MASNSHTHFCLDLKEYLESAVDAAKRRRRYCITILLRRMLKKEGKEVYIHLNIVVYMERRKEGGGRYMYEQVCCAVRWRKVKIGRVYLYMHCIPLSRVPSMEKINPRLRMAVQEIIYFLYLPIPPSAHHDALCIGSDKAEMIFYIDLRKKMKECMDDCLDLQRKVVETCREKKQEEEYECPEEFIEDIERERCRGICEDMYVENAETALFRIQDRLRILDRYRIRYVERVSRPSRYEIVVKAYMDPQVVKGKT